MCSNAACNSALLSWHPQIFIPLTTFLHFRTRISHEVWRSKEARYHHHLLLVRHRKKPCICVTQHVFMMQQPVLCTPSVGHFLPAASIKPLVLPCRTIDSQASTEGKNSFWRIASLFKKTDNMFLKSDFICLKSLGWQEDDSSTGMTVALFLGNNHKSSFHLLLWT